MTDSGSYRLPDDEDIAQLVLVQLVDAETKHVTDLAAESNNPNVLDGRLDQLRHTKRYVEQLIAQRKRKEAARRGR